MRSRRVRRIVDTLRRTAEVAGVGACREVFRWPSAVGSLGMSPVARLSRHTPFARVNGVRGSAGFVGRSLYRLAQSEGQGASMTFSRGTRAAATRVGLTVLALIATSAAPPPDNPTPRQCLDAFNSTAPEIDYVGDGWPGALVAGPPQSWMFSFFDDTDRDFRLYCGDERSGVVHIAGESTGTGHPISEADQDWFIGCWNVVIGAGTAEDDGNGRTRFTLVRGRTKSVAFVDNARRFTYSLYTSSDSWEDCYLAWWTS